MLILPLLPKQLEFLPPPSGIGLPVERSHGLPGKYRELVAAVAAAAAQARVTAELACFTEDPKTWLTKGPGRETAETPGWSGVVRPVVALTDNRSVNLLTDPTSSAILTMLLAALAPYPEARRAAIDALNQSAERRVIPSIDAPRNALAGQAPSTAGEAP